MASKTLSIARSEKLPFWIWDVLKPSQPVVFANTDDIVVPSRGKKLAFALEEERGGSRVNRIEAALVSLLVRAYLQHGIEPSNIGCISPYKAQVKLIQELLQNIPAVDVSTIDKYQGKDKDIIVISLMRSNVDSMVCRTCSRS